MICFLLTRDHDYTLAQVRKSGKVPGFTLLDYDSLIRARSLKQGTYIFGDLDRLGFWDLELVSHRYLQLKKLGFKVWNNPARVKTRYPLLRALHAAGLNDFTAHRANDLSSVIRFPVFLRSIQGHSEPLTDLIPTRGELDAVIESAVASGIPSENLMVVEFAAEPVRAGVYRKWSAFRIGAAIVPHSCVHDNVWLVKHGQRLGGIEDLYQEEHTMLEANSHAEHLKKVFEVAEIEYGRADYGVYRGRIQVYEINTNPTLFSGHTNHPSATRIASTRVIWEKYLQALALLDSGDGQKVQLPADKKFKRYSSWKSFFVSSRRVP